MLNEAHGLYEVNRHWSPYWPADALRKAMGISDDKSLASFSNVSDKFKELSSLTPESLRATEDLKGTLNVASLLAIRGRTFASEKLIKILYDEGAQLGKALGENAIYAKIPDMSAEQMKEGIQHFGTLEKFAGYVHIRDFFHKARDANKLEYMRDSGLNEAEVVKYAAQLTENLDAAGHNGIHRLLENHPHIADAYKRDTTHIVVPRYQGQATHDVPIAANHTRAAYLAKEMEYSQSSRYLGEAYIHAAGKEYSQVAEQKDVVLKEIRNRRAQGEPLSFPLREKMVEIVKHSRIGSPDYNHEYASELKHTLLHKYGTAFIDPKFIEELRKKNALPDEVILALDEAAHGGLWSRSGEIEYPLPHVRELAKEIEKTHTLHGVSPVEHAAESQKKTLQEAGKHISEQPLESLGQSLGHPPHATQAKVAVGDIKATIGTAERSGFRAGRIGATGLFGVALYDGLKNMNEDNRDKANTKKIKFARVAEMVLGAAGLAATWMLKDKTLQGLFSKGKAL